MYLKVSRTTLSFTVTLMIVLHERTRKLRINMDQENLLYWEEYDKNHALKIIDKSSLMSV